MVLIVEDGTCVPDADSFVSLEHAETYFTNYGGFWTGADSLKEAALRRASAYISMLPWFGRKVCGRNQALGWPREGVFDCGEIEIPSDTVPIEVVRATLAAASYELRYPGGLSPNIVPGQQVLKEKVDVIEVTYMTAEQQGLSSGDPVTAQRPVLTQINDLLQCMANLGGIKTPWPFVV